MLFADEMVNKLSMNILDSFHYKLIIFLGGKLTQKIRVLVKQSKPFAWQPAFEMPGRS